MSASRPRIFLKHPAVPPPSGEAVPAPVGRDLVGPFDEIRYPSWIALPVEHGADAATTETRVDYEVEIAVVIGRTLTRESAGHASDDELRSALAGCVLISDTKARNPQVMGKILQDDRSPREDNPYRFDDTFLDAALGIWDESTCHWWSYAASRGSDTSVGPFFVARGPDTRLLPRAVVSARSYATPEVRGARIPRGRTPGVLYLRQCSVTTEEAPHSDRLIWAIPQLIRSILAPDNALRFFEDPVRLEPGDLICLGTPGGTVITVKPYTLFDTLEDVVFWWRPKDWHDMFFEADAGLYLHPGDELFLWAEGLGFQRLRIALQAS
jgi:2-keto-4-pentenoate hydratase/2-oxohepta-3-ene-1,7-dioic acid hydratase in catechol pathway